MYTGVITLRVWHLFHRNRFIGWLAAAAFILCAAGTAVASGLKFGTVRDVLSNPLAAAKSSIFLIYVPSLVIHTVMFSLKVYRFHVSPRALQRHGIIYRLLKEYVSLSVTSPPVETHVLLEGCSCMRLQLVHLSRSCSLHRR